MFRVSSLLFLSAQVRLYIASHSAESLVLCISGTLGSAHVRGSMSPKQMAVMPGTKNYETLFGLMFLSLRTIFWYVTPGKGGPASAVPWLPPSPAGALVAPAVAAGRGVPASAFVPVASPSRLPTPHAPVDREPEAKATALSVGRVFRSRVVEHVRSSFRARGTHAGSR